MNQTFKLVSVTAVALVTGIIHSSDCRTAFAQTGTREYQEPQAKTGQIAWSTDADGRHYVTTLKLSRLAATPNWDDDKEHPPLSARQAITAARKVVGKLAPYGGEAELNSPTLKLRESHGHWFWVVYFSPNDFRQFQSTFPVIVLMDGSVVHPIKKRHPPDFGNVPQKKVTN